MVFRLLFPKTLLLPLSVERITTYYLAIAHVRLLLSSNYRGRDGVPRVGLPAPHFALRIHESLLHSLDRSLLDVTRNIKSF